MEPHVPSQFTRKETFVLHNTLLCLAKSLENRYTTIDLRNETSITGKIVEVDSCMNIILKDAALFESDGKYQYFPTLHVHSRNIRNIHIPDNISIMKAIKSQVEKVHVKQPRKLTFKEIRAKRQQQEILEMIAKNKETEEKIKDSKEE